MHSFWTTTDTSDGVEYDLVTLSDVKTDLGITGDSENDSLTARITRVSKLIAEYTDRDFALLDVVETFVFGTCERLKSRDPLVLRQYPVVEIESVTVNDSEITDYEVDAEKGLLYRTGGAYWSGRVVVTYRGGYDLTEGAPAALQQAAIEAIRQVRAFSSADPTIRSTAHGDTSVGYYSAPQQGSHGLPASVISAINSFRRVTVA